MSPNASVNQRIDETWLRDAVKNVFIACGLAAAAAQTVADALVDADMRGISSHGVMLVPMYTDRLRAGSVTTADAAEVVSDNGATAVLDAKHAMGILTADQAMGLAIDKASVGGAGVVTVRHAFHFGAASRYVEQAARKGFIGIAAANTRPLMPAPGGARAVVGNNPLAIGVPNRDADPVILDMALSEAALGKVRLAAQEGRTIPPTWAADAAGVPTTDPAAAIDGLLLPAGGPKGYGLAFMIDVLTGVMSGGAFGNQVQGLYADTSTHNDCAHFFVALDPGAFGRSDDFPARVAELGAQVLASPTAPGTDRVMLPGELELQRLDAARREGIPMSTSVMKALEETAAAVGATLSGKGEVS